ncbi:MAG: SMC-Scp complex subunit ScpB [Candidatus Marinimicrobia bacterium]|nr:SMC-Scp complex subunit ScpB [Candidatus Neomarinimicrobiota bacterium]
MINHENDSGIEETNALAKEELGGENSALIPSEEADQIANQDEGRDSRFSTDLRILEALLFATSEPVTEHMISERLNSGADIPALLEELKTVYKGRGVELLQASGRWSFRTAPDISDRLKLEKFVPRKLSRAAIETLAIIAYHQPVTRAEIEEIRSVSVSSGTLDILLEEGWVKPRGRKQVPGRPIMWGTTNSFLDHFGLESIQDLPGIDELRTAGLLDSRQGLAAYATRGGSEDTLLFDTEDSDEAFELLQDEEELDSVTKPDSSGSQKGTNAVDQDSGGEES